MENYPSNSRESRDLRAVPDPEEKHFEKIVDTPPIRRKKTLGSRVRDLFFQGDNVFEYVVREVLVPAFKDTMSDAVSSTMERMLFGENGERRTRRTPSRSSAFGSPGHTNYTRYSSTSTSRENTRPIPVRNRVSNDFDELIFATKLEANRILDQMDEAIRKYGHVSVRDLYEMVGEQFHYTDEKYGWTDLRRASTRRIANGGYLLDLPKVEVLED